MKSYYLNTVSTGNPGYNNEVHTADCAFCPSVFNRVYLGEYSNGVQAVRAAKAKGWSNADGCIHCCPDAHHG